MRLNALRNKNSKTFYNIVRFFSYFADQAFRTGEQGERLFCLGWPLSKPIIIENEGQYKKTYAKYLWMQRVFLTFVVLGQPFLFSTVPEIMGSLFGFIAYLAMIVSVDWVAHRIVFRFEIREFQRRSQRRSFRDFHKQMADRSSTAGLLLGLVVCILFVMCGIWIAVDPSVGLRSMGIFISALFGAAGVSWVFALKLKCFTKTSSE